MHWELIGGRGLSYSVWLLYHSQLVALLAGYCWALRCLGWRVKFDVRSVWVRLECVSIWALAAAVCGVVFWLWRATWSTGCH